MSLIKIWVPILLLSLLLACAGTEKTEIQTAEAVFNKAMEKFNKEDYLEAINLFGVIKLQYPASQYADDAQFYLAETYFKRKEFVMASYNYSSLRRYYPNSSFIKDCMYKVAQCYVELSPTYDRDQEYTLKAIQALSEFQSVYPKDSLSLNANKLIADMRDKLGHREMFNAELYRTLLSPHSALIYYNTVISDFDDTKYLEDAMFGKVEVLCEMKKYDQAQSAIDAYKTKYPNGSHFAHVKELESGLPKK